MGFVVPGAPEGSTGRLVLVDVFGKARDRTCDPWFTRLIHCTTDFPGRTGEHKIKKNSSCDPSVLMLKKVELRNV